MTDRPNEVPREPADSAQQVVNAIAHDLQAPTRHVKSFLQLLEAHLGDGLDAQGREYVERISGAVDVLQTKLGSLRNLSRAATGEVELELCDVGDAIGDAKVALDSEIRSAEAVVDIEVSGSVTFDRAQLVAVFAELLGNSLKFCESPIRITVSSEISDGRSVVSVVDSGPGFRARNVDEAFDLFRRFHHADVPGAGAGLTVVRQILDRHRGLVSIESSPEAGTTVRITLPLS